MKIATAFRNLDTNGLQRAPQIIGEEARRLDVHLQRFNRDLVRLEAVVRQTRGKTRIHVSLRLQLPSGVIATQEEGFEVEPVLREAFTELGRRLERHLARLTRESEWKRRARQPRPDPLLPPARDQAEADRRALYFELIEAHLDTIYHIIRRELTYLEASGVVPEGYLSVRDLVDATLLKGLERFEARSMQFSVDHWLTRLAYDTLDEEVRAAQRAMPASVQLLSRAPEAPAREPTASDEQLFDFYQPDDVLMLEELISDDTTDDPETAAERRQAALSLQHVVADLPLRWRKVLLQVDVEETAPETVAALLEMPLDEVLRIAEAARAFVRDRMRDAGLAPTLTDAAMRAARNRRTRIPQPIADRHRIEAALIGPHGQDA